ncbi:toll/interleukin-1 receptor domain-containing protein [Frankia nepalensis]|uniref:toll/interleukin-1 receptor domain-containing protein n=1 Tax=Frankia nepalensis TaxID=1836974 RepID=UPI002B1BDEC2|nr:toll/interleukin-1 receptor domain-containing protein [Frankia nepalensis]
MGRSGCGGLGAVPRAERWDFFVSFTGADRAWAEWVAWQWEDAGYRVLIRGKPVRRWTV